MTNKLLHQEHRLACRTVIPGASDACTRLLLVGEVNPISNRLEHALYCAPAGCSGHRLQETIFGLPRVHYLALWRTNLCRGGWSKVTARSRAEVLLGADCPWDVVVMLGRQVASAFAPLMGLSGAARPADVSQVARPGRPPAVMVAIGHPSGLNRQWNEPGVIQHVRDLMTLVAPGVPWGTA